MTFNKDVIPCKYCGQFPTVTGEVDDETGLITGAIAFCETESCIKKNVSTRVRKDLDLLAEEWNDLN